MNVCVVGAGSIGGYLVARLTGAGNDVTVIARGANLAAIKQRGLRLTSTTGDEVARPASTGGASSAALFTRPAKSWSRA